MRFCPNITVILTAQFQGQQLVSEHIPGSDNIPERVAETRGYYDKLRQLADARRRTLEGGVEYYQFFTDADDVETYLLDTMRVVSSDDVGRDEGSTNALLRKHEGVSDEIQMLERHIEQLQAQVAELPEEARAHPDIIERLSITEARKKELEDLALVRKQRLIDALSLYKLLSDVDSVEGWIDEKVRC